MFKKEQAAQTSSANNNISKEKKVIKAKFKAKLEIEKRKQEFLNSMKDLRKSQHNVASKNSQLKELIKQEKIKLREELVRKNIEYKEAIRKQKQLVASQKNLIRNEKIKSREATSLEMAKIRQEILNRKLRFQKEISIAKQKRRQAILDGKEEIQKIMRKSELVAQEDSKKFEQGKLKIARQKVVHLENLANQQKELENLKKQKELANLNFYQKLREFKRKRIAAQRLRKQEIDALVQKEKNSLQLDIAKMKKQQLSYKNLLKVKAQEEKIELEQLKLETEKLEQAEKAKTIMESSLHGIVEKGSIPTSQVVGAHVEISHDKSLDDSKLLLPINLNNETIKGIVINEVGKKALRVFTRVNKNDTTYPLERAKISNEEKHLIEKVRDLKLANSLVPIGEYAKLAAFIENKPLTNEKIQGIIISVVYNLLRGKTLSFLGGYFSIVKVRGYRKIIYSQSTRLLSRFSIVSLPESPVTKKFEEILAQKLAFEPFIKIAGNIVLTNVNNQIKVVTDIAFMR